MPERLADADIVATPCSTSDAAAGHDVRMEVAISKGSKKTNTQVSRNSMIAPQTPSQMHLIIMWYACEAFWITHGIVTDR